MPSPVKINFRTLSGVKRSNYAIRFMVGGVMTALAGIISQHFGAGVGGLFLAFPAILPATATLIAKHQLQKKASQGLRGNERALDVAALDANGAAVGSLGLIGFAAVAWRLLPRLPAPLALFIATAAWMLLSLAAWLIRRNRHRIRAAFVSGQNVRYGENSARRDLRRR
jgi:Protein of unknown function (DUF3147)